MDDLAWDARLREARRDAIARGMHCGPRRSACAVKVRHETETVANWEAVRLYVLYGADVVVYRCWWCAGWHCGNPGGRVAVA